MHVVHLSVRASSWFVGFPVFVLAGASVGCHLDRPESVVSETIAIEAHEGTKLGFDLSPDGRSIVFDLLGQLWLLPAEGGEATPITDAVRDTTEDLDPNFLPDGKSIVFRSDRPGGVGVWLLSLEEGSTRKLIDQEPPSNPIRWPPPHPAPSPDGRYLAYTVWDTIFILDVEVGTTRQLAIEGLPQPAIPPGRLTAAVSLSRMQLGGRRRVGGVGAYGRSMRTEEPRSPSRAKIVWA